MTHVPLDPQRWAVRAGAWLQPGGPQGDVVVSCRARLARNLAEFPFVTRLEPKRAEELAARFAPFAATLAANEATIVDELNAVQGAPCDIGGYYSPDFDLATAAMRPSPTFNAAVDAL